MKKKIVATSGNEGEFTTAMQCIPGRMMRGLTKGET